jgi:hypothetical protein
MTLRAYDRATLRIVALRVGNSIEGQRQTKGQNPSRTQRTNERSHARIETWFTVERAPMKEGFATNGTESVSQRTNERTS